MSNDARALRRPRAGDRLRLALRRFGGWPGVERPRSRRRPMARFGAIVLSGVALLLPTWVLAAQAPDAFDYRVLLNTDLDPATGCGVHVQDANIDTTVP